MKNYPVSRKDSLVIQEMDGEILIYDLAENKAFCLNETSALVWQACDGNKDVPEISKLVGKELNSPVNEDLVWFALDQLKKENLIENAEDLPNHFAGMSRREVIKKVGLGTMAALPIVAGLVAPSALHAQSCVGPGGTFTVMQTIGNCGSDPGPICLTNTVTRCCNMTANSAFQNFDNPTDTFDCICAP